MERTMDGRLRSTIIDTHYFFTHKCVFSICRLRRCGCCHICACPSRVQQECRILTLCQTSFASLDHFPKGLRVGLVWYKSTTNHTASFSIAYPTAMKRRAAPRLSSERRQCSRHYWSLVVAVFSLSLIPAQAFLRHTATPLASTSPWLRSTVPGWRWPQDDAAAAASHNHPAYTPPFPPRTTTSTTTKRSSSSFPYAPPLGATPSTFDQGPRRHSRRGRWHHHNNNNKASRKEWLAEATQRLLHTETGALTGGKWHEVKSLLHGWAALAKDDADAPVRMEALIKRLVQEEEGQGRHDLVDMRDYNALLDAWACAALFKTMPHGGGDPPSTASQRAVEILVTLQDNYRQQQRESNRHDNDDNDDNDEYCQSFLQPDQRSFDVVLHAAVRTQGPLVARRLLAWKEYLYKTGQNTQAKPQLLDYVRVLDAYANTRSANAGTLAEALVAHMKATPEIPNPDTHCYNIVLKAWTRSRRGRQAAEHADKILEEMDTEPDIITYATAVSAWAHSGMKRHAVSRAEELWRAVQEHPTLQPNTVLLNAVLSAWVKTKDRAAVDRTAEILQQMQDGGQADLISYNTHLHCLAVHGNVPGNARRAEAMLEFLEQQQQQAAASTNNDLQPNGFSYNCALAACSKSADEDAAVRAVAIFQRLLKQPHVKPDTFAFNQLLLALSRSKLPEAAAMTRKWLGYMEFCYEKGIFPKARPDAVSYLAVISAYSRSGVRGAALDAEQIFQDLHTKYYASGRRELKPNKYLYNAMIDCWAKSKEGTRGARKAEALLNEMQKQYEAGDVGMQPDLISYNGVLNAWARSNTRCCARQAEIYLERMWELHQKGNKKVKPDDKSYNTVINAISKSKHARKAQRALRVLRTMDLLYRSGQMEVRPSEITYTAVLNSCAFPVARDSRSRRKALDTALFTLAELQSSEYCRPNEATYGTFIRACANLLHDDVELRRQIIAKAFKQCCRDGQVGDNVLSFLRKAAPSDLYQELLADFISSGGTTTTTATTMITAEDLPLEWRCNVGGSVHPSSGRGGGGNTLLVSEPGQLQP